MERSSSAAWVRGVLSMFAASGVSTDAVLRAAGVSPARLTDAETRFHPDEVSALWQAALDLSGNPLLGVDRTLAERFADIDMIGFVMMSCENLLEGLRQFERYLGVISNATTFALQPEGGDHWLLLNHAGHTLPIPPQRSTYSLLALLIACRWATRRKLAPLRARLSFPAPAAAPAFEAALGCPVAFDAADNAMLLSGADLREPLPSRDPAMLTLHTALLQRRLAALADEGLRSRVSAEITRRLARGEPRRQEVAEALGLTDRTLQRRLQLESVSFQQLMDEARRTLAQTYLADPNFTVGQVAYLLGFAEQSNFFRACRRWFGHAAGVERQRLQQQALRQPPPEA